MDAGLDSQAAGRPEARRWAGLVLRARCCSKVLACVMHSRAQWRDQFMFACHHSGGQQAEKAPVRAPASCHGIYSGAFPSSPVSREAWQVGRAFGLL